MNAASLVESVGFTCAFAAATVVSAALCVCAQPISKTGAKTAPQKTRFIGVSPPVLPAEVRRLSPSAANLTWRYVRLLRRDETRVAEAAPAMAVSRAWLG